jgi:hypothetical protein
MTDLGASSSAIWKRLLLVAFALFVAWYIAAWIREGIRKDKLVAVDFGGTHHFGPDFSISEFYLNGANGFNVGREGGGEPASVAYFSLKRGNLV